MSSVTSSTTHAVLNTQIMRMARRAENAHREVLRDSFVPLPPLLAQLDSEEHQVVFGRRGTGKTHLMHAVRRQRAAEGSLALYLDLRTVGSADDLSTERREEFRAQATGLLVDVVEAIHGQILEQVLDDDRWDDRLEPISEALNDLADAATRIRVVGETEVEQDDELTEATRRSAGAELGAGRDPRLSLRREASRERSRRAALRTLQRGRQEHHVLLGPLSAAVRRLTAAIRPNRLWLLLDEWSALPLELQPLLADLLRRTLFATEGVVVKIGAIHGRTRFSELSARANPLGLELGADTAATLDLDDFLLFRNDAAATYEFYSALLFRHLTATVGTAPPASQARLLVSRLRSPADLTNQLFESRGAFETLVVAAEGVPRDTLQIVNLAAGMADTRPIGCEHVRGAARRFFLRDKETTIPRAARPVFHEIMDRAVRQRGRLVPLRRDGESDDEVVQLLYDTRILHRLHQGLSLDHQDPTELYDVYVIDYGAFLGLLRSGRIRVAEDGLDPWARFVDVGEIALRSRTFVRMPQRWYRARLP